MSLHHSFDIDIATKYGVPVAIFMNHLAFWIQKNQANNKNIHKDRAWTYNSVEAFLVIFPYWTTDQMRGVIKKCIDLGLIIKGTYNSKAYDRKNWYTLTDESHKLLNLPIWEKPQMDSGKIPNAFGENPEPIADINTDSKAVKIKSSCDEPPKKPKEKPKTKTRKDHNNEVKHPWHSNAKVCEPITQDATICEDCKRPSHTGSCSNNGLMPKELRKLFAGKALAAVTGRRLSR